MWEMMRKFMDQRATNGIPNLLLEFRCACHQPGVVLAGSVLAG